MVKIGVFALISIVLIVMTTGCTSSAISANDSIYIERVYEKQFSGDLEKYDNALSKAQSINEQLTALESNIDSLPEITAKILTDLEILTVGATAETAVIMNKNREVFKEFSDNPEKVIATLKEKLSEAKVNLVITIDDNNGTIDAKIKIKGLGDEEAEAAKEKINEIQERFRLVFEPAIRIKKNFVRIGNDSKELAVILKSLSENAKTDFNGMNAMKLPGAVKSLTQATGQMAEVPAKLEKITKKLPGVILGLSKLIVI